MDALTALSPLQTNYGIPGAGGLNLGGLGAASCRCCGASGAMSPMGPMGGQTDIAQMQSSLVQMLALLMAGAGNPQGMANLAQAAAPLASSGSSGSSGSSESGGASSSGSTSSGGGVGQASAQPKDQGEIDQFIKEAAGAYGADANVLREIARRESNFKADAVNNWDSNAKKGTPSKGMFQFIEPTFKSMAPKAKAANPKAWEGLGELNWMDWRQQALTTAWAISTGQGSHWATYKAAGGK